MAFTSILGSADAVLGLTLTLGEGTAAYAGITYNLTADNTLTLTQSAVLEGIFDLTAENSITFTNTQVTASGDFSKTAANAITFTQEADVVTPIEVTASASLSLTQAASKSILTVTAESSLSFSQTVTLAAESDLTASSNLSFSHSALVSPITVTAESPIVFFQTNNRFILSDGGTDLTASNTLSLSQSNNRVHMLASADILTASSNLTITQRGIIPTLVDATNSVAFSHTAVVVVGKSGTQTLTFSQSAVGGKSGSYTASNTLNLKQTFIWLQYRGGIPVVGSGGCNIEQQYAPLSGSGNNVVRPIAPDLEEKNDVVFFYPYGPVCSATDSITLRTPNFGDRDRNQYNRINRESRGGSLRVFRDPDWPQQRTLVMDFSGVKDNEVDSILEFLETTLGLSVGFRDWQGRVWSGVITTPNSPVVRQGTNRNDISLEMDVDEYSLQLNACNEVEFSQQSDVVLV